MLLLLGEVALPLPSRSKDVARGRFGTPTKNLVGFLGVSPNLLDISLTTSDDLIRQVDTRYVDKRAYDLQHTQSASRTEVEDLYLLVRFALEHALNGFDMRNAAI